MKQLVLAVTGPAVPVAVRAELAEWVAEIRDLPGDLSTSALLRELRGVNFYALGGSERLGSAFFDRVPESLSHICFMGTGYQSHVDPRLAAAAGVVLCHTPHANARSTAEFAFSLALAGRRNIFELARGAKTGRWSPTEERSLSRSHVGIVGFGRVGREFHRLIRPVCAATYVWNRTDPSAPARRMGARPASMQDIFASCDLISIHADFPPAESGHLIGAGELLGARPDLVLVNSARAAAVDPDALRVFLAANPRAVALFDGYYREPVDVRSDPHGLLELKQFTLTPHAAFLTDESNFLMGRMLLENVRAAAVGGRIPHPVRDALRRPHERVRRAGNG